MKNCCNCGAPIDPYRVKCDYCGTMYFDWATWMQEGKTCYINYTIDGADKKMTVTSQAVPHLETLEVKRETKSLMSGDEYILKHIDCGCDAHLVVDFTCLVNPENRTLFTVREEKKK